VAKNKVKSILLSMGICTAIPFFSQVSDVLSSVHGNFQVDAQYYKPDSLIGAPVVPEKFLSNAFGNVNFTSGNFTAGFRYESYQNVMIGFDPRYKGSGVPYRYMRYKYKDLDFTLGNFYDQFGSGLIFRAYEERGLLYDNTIDGVRAVYRPGRGITLKGFVGKQRTFFSQSPGILRGFDGEWNLNEINDSLAKKKTKIILGGSFISKYQEDQDPTYNLPLNVGCYSGRINIVHEGFNFLTEGAYKINDPSFNNSYSYRDGKGLYVTTSYAMKGFSVSLAAKAIDNMSFRSDRSAKLSAAMINFLPALTKPHTYLMMAYYPYATQPNGEIGAMGEIQYKAKKGTKIGGKYGWEVTLNGSVAYGTDTTNRLASRDSAHYNYDINYGDAGLKYFHDYNIEFSKKFSKIVKGTFMYANQFYNKNMVQFGSPNAGYDDIASHIGVADITWKYKSGKALRFEAQTLITEADKGSWAVGLVEWTISSQWFLTVLDQYNYGNPDEAQRLHYYLANMTYVNGPTRIVLQYGKQRAGIFCVGGVCRFVPASNGVSVSISSSF
jgi:hypothetical protein